MGNLKLEFGKKLATLRKVSNLTQEQLANKADVSVDLISLLERGKNSPSFDTLEKLSVALEISVKEFFNFID